MAPAAADTIAHFFTDTSVKLSEIDGIYTGDLGMVGSKLLYELLEREGIEIRSKHKDCGLLLYDRDKQDVHAGGSGCGCSASVLCSYLLPELERGSMRNILFVATGALLSTTLSLIHISLRQLPVWSEYRRGVLSVPVLPRRLQWHPN